MVAAQECHVKNTFFAASCPPVRAACAPRGRGRRPAPDPPAAPPGTTQSIKSSSLQYIAHRCGITRGRAGQSRADAEPAKKSVLSDGCASLRHFPAKPVPNRPGEASNAELPCRSAACGRTRHACRAPFRDRGSVCGGPAGRVGSACPTGQGPGSRPFCRRSCTGAPPGLHRFSAGLPSQSSRTSLPAGRALPRVRARAPGPEPGSPGRDRPRPRASA